MEKKIHKKRKKASRKYKTKPCPWFRDKGYCFLGD